MPAPRPGNSPAMKVYADDPARRTRQQLLDGAVLVLLVGLVQLGRWVHRAVDALAGPERSLQGGASDLSGNLASAARSVGSVPYAGDALRQPLDQAAQAGQAV